MIQLKIKTEYSFGQTFAPINRVIARLVELGCTSAGIVDDSTWGHVPWFYACKEAGIQPLLGVECFVCNSEDIPLKMWFLAKNKKGLIELYNNTSKSHHQKVKTTRGSFPRLYKDDVLNMSSDIIKFAGDITDGSFLKKAKAYLDLSPASIILNQSKLSLSESHKLKLVSVGDNAYVYPDDATTFEIMSKAGLKMTPQYILDNLDNQQEAKRIARQCNKLELPIAPMISDDGDLESLCRKGIKERKMKWNNKYEERLKYELDMIKSKDYESYFTIVADMVRYAKKHMLVGPSRGSAAGSLVCYLSRITEIDPIPAGLYFERFIDISRKDLPDIDLDFPDSKRHLVFEYMADKYGVNNTAHIGTILKFKPKSALITVCKAMDIPAYETAAVKIAMIERSIADRRATDCLLDTFNTTSPGQEFIKQYPEAIIATYFEGHASHTGVHAAGLLVCNDEITNYCTVDDRGIAHVEKYSAEKIGLLKIDVLGLRTLSILEDIPHKIDWYNMKFDDSLVYEIFNKELLCGIFQFEGEAMRSIAKQLEFNNLDDIDAVTALARPGPFGGGVTLEYIKRKNGKPFKPIHKLVEKHMAESFQLPIYQEQTISIVREIGNFTWEQTTLVRKAMSKSLGVDYFKDEGDKFIEGARTHGLDDKVSEKIWETICAMGAWQMNKAHTRSYAVISYWTAYLKAHYPLDFAASNLRHTRDEDSAVLLLREMKREGIDYIPFDIDKSQKDWAVIDGKLYGGFTCLKGIGESKADKLIEARNNGSLTTKQIEMVLSSHNPFDNIFPFHSNYQELYEHPEKFGIASKVYEIADINTEHAVPHKHERVFIGEIISKSARDINETIYIKKRKGKIEEPPTAFVDIKVRDDHGVIGARVDRWKFDKIGRELLQEIPIGSRILIRAKFFNGIPWAFITKWKMLDEVYNVGKE